LKRKKHTKKTKKKQSKAAKERMKNPKNNPMFGKRWIHSPVEKVNKIIGKKELIPEGWMPGRKFKWP